MSGQPGEALPFAVCAPGRRPIAEIVLALCGEQVSAVREHPWLEGLEAVYVITPPPEKLPPVLPFRFSAAPSPLTSVMRDRQFALAAIRPAWPLVLGSVA